MTSEPANRQHHADSASQDDQDWDGISLEELGEAYAKAIAQSDASAVSDEQAAVSDEQAAVSDEQAAVSDEQAADGGVEPESASSSSAAEDEAADAEQDSDAIPTPPAIIEAALFIGTPEGRAMSEAELAALMRGVTAQDVSRYIDRLNEGYQANEQAFRIHRDEDGLRMGVAPDMEIVRRAFYGKIRETRLSQPAIEVLSLVAYQPGISADKVQDQRGKESGSLLSQLVRRRLLEQRRTVPEGGTRPIATYHPTERFLQLFGLDSLDDLPQVES